MGLRSRPQCARSSAPLPDPDDASGVAAAHAVGILSVLTVSPIVAGLGCNVPAIMGTRVLPTRRERILSSVLITLMPCSAWLGLPAVAGQALMIGVLRKEFAH